MVANTRIIPELNTAAIAPLSALQRQLLSQQKEIEAWFEEEWKKSRPPVYG